MTRLARTMLTLAVLAAVMGSASTCPGEAGTAPHTSRPGTYTYRVIAEGTPRRAHIYVKVGPIVKIDEARNLPWHTYIRLRPVDDLTFNVSLIDVLDTKDVVTCKIEDADRNERDRDGPHVVAKCYLAAMTQPA